MTARPPTTDGRLRVRVPLLFEAEGEGRSAIICVALIAGALVSLLIYLSVIADFRRTDASLAVPARSERGNERTPATPHRR